MAENSRIGWTTHTFNAWIGCCKVSEGCANCYADEQDKFRKWTPEGWGPGKPRRRTSEDNWRNPIRWNEQARKAWAAAPTSRPPAPTFVFCSSLADWLDDDGVPIEWLADLLELIRRTPMLTWQMLTKRPQNWRPRLEAVVKWFDSVPILSEDRRRFVTDWLAGTPPAHVWFGISTENQKRLEERVPIAEKIPAVVRFLSAEPLLGALDLYRLAVTDDEAGAKWTLRDRGFHWLILGGESGPKARPMCPAWADVIMAACLRLGISFFFKQWGESIPHVVLPPALHGRAPDFCVNYAGEIVDPLPDHVPNDHWPMWRVGVKAAHLAIEGRVLQQFPTPDRVLAPSQMWP